MEIQSFIICFKVYVALEVSGDLAMSQMQMKIRGIQFVT